jgi:hypothetical protein
MVVNEAEIEAAGLVQTWAEAVLRQGARYRDAWTSLNRAWNQFDRMEDWSPDVDDRSRVFRELWAEAHLLVWTAHQLEVWRARLAAERNEQRPSQDERLKTVRDVLEHLDEAEFRDGRAVPGQEAIDMVAAGLRWEKMRWRGLLALPDRALETALTDDGLLFGLLDPEALETTARQALMTIDSEILDRAADEWVESQEG